MHPALWVGKTGLNAMDTKLSTISNNLANVNTVGFKRERAVFEDLLYQIKRMPGTENGDNAQIPSGLQLGTGVRVAGTQKQFTEGNVNTTSQTLDIMINGRGFFRLATPDGDVAYTRNGQFHLDSEGRVVNTNGLPLDPEIVVPDNTTDLTIGQDGTVEVITDGDTANPQQIGQIDVVDFINPAGLMAMGNNIFKETAGSGAPNVGVGGEDGFGAVTQGALEQSNVSAVEEMVDMITTQRAYEMNTKVVSTADEMLRNLTQTL
ncbi:flagellar basal-body rod protein FlgG [Terasakiispira papahanaumokuakeensis]|uniref:Flagellar basal-body rod protein FlgG n=1 Tax=Terasakiispira papahanaumokuakeensis TaxID=197479 RepID=A0A1E2VAY4_9GAMM|nr:flagellar basal-body rod protein FlgG [Terasakiispira papahanaumokuakeensis]ODC04179.1 flagellar basal-body rod protein FlgG [Terasakiispira papahanaumokuakeensis]